MKNIGCNTAVEWKNQKLRRIAYVVVIILLMMGCRREVQKTLPVSGEKKFTGNYSSIENYEVVEGPHKGFKGSSSYTIQLRDNRGYHFLLIENIANAYKVIGIWSEDSIFLSTQKFPYYNDSVTISGRGRFSGDSLFLNFFSGGPAGQIKSVFKAKKLYK